MPVRLTGMAGAAADDTGTSAPEPSTAGGEPAPGIDTLPGTSITIGSYPLPSSTRAAITTTNASAAPMSHLRRDAGADAGGTTSGAGAGGTGSGRSRVLRRESTNCDTSKSHRLSASSMALRRANGSRSSGNCAVVGMSAPSTSTGITRTSLRRSAVAISSRV